MSKGGGGGGTATSTKKDEKGNFVSGFQPFPAAGAFPIFPQQNYWQDGNFMMPGVSQPLMATNLLTRFPQLAELFGGRVPDVQTSSMFPQSQPLFPAGTTTGLGSDDDLLKSAKEKRKSGQAFRRNV